MTGMLSRHELDFLTGKLQLEGKDAINARYRIKKELIAFLYLEMPLIVDYERKTSPLVEIRATLLKYLGSVKLSSDGGSHQASEGYMGQHRDPN